jgi:hypothetical protein
VLSVKVNAREFAPSARSRPADAMSPDASSRMELSRGNAARRSAVGIFRRCRIKCDATGAVPRSSAGADPSRGVRQRSYKGAALDLASDTRRRRDTGLAAHRCSVGRRGALSTRRTQRVSPTIPIRATHDDGLRTSCPRNTPSLPRGGERRIRPSAEVRRPGPAAATRSRAGASAPRSASRRRGARRRAARAPAAVPPSGAR